MDGMISAEEESNTSLKIDWLDLAFLGYPQSVAISGLPGYRYKDTRQNLQNDIDDLLALRISDIFMLCTKNELKKYKVKNLFQKYYDSNFMVHFYPVERGNTPNLSDLANVFRKLNECIESGRKAVIHCVGGLGRSSVIAVCYLLHTNDNISEDETIESIRLLKGPGAIQTIQQYNFIQDFRNLWDEYSISCDEENHSVSR